MERRELLTLAAASLPAGGLVLGANTVRADVHEPINVISNVVRNRTWKNQLNDYRRFQWGALFYEGLVYYLGPPEGRLPERDDGGGPEYRRVLGLLPQSWQEWLQDRASATDSFAKINADNVVSVLGQVVDQNWNDYVTWLEQVGIVVSGSVSNAMLSGQTLATLVSLAETRRDDGEESNESILSRLRSKFCFYPLCPRK